MSTIFLWLIPDIPSQYNVYFVSHSYDAKIHQFSVEYRAPHMYLQKRLHLGNR